MISYIIVSYNTVDYTLQMLRSLLLNCRDCEAIVVDNASTDGTVEAINKEFGSSIKVISSKENLGFSKANNLGVENSLGEFLVFINPDTVVSSDIGAELLRCYHSYYCNQDVILSPTIKNPDGTPQHSMNLFPVINMMLPFRKFMKILNKKLLKRIPSEWITGVCYGISRATFQKLRGWNELYDLYSEDLDICYRLKKILGGRTYSIKNLSIVHYGNQSAKKVYATEYMSYKKKTDSLKKFYLQYYDEKKFIKYLRFIYKMKQDKNLARYLQEEI